MKEKKKYYKLVRVLWDRRLRSAYTSDEKWLKFYEKGKWTYPDKGLLFVFSSYKTAEWWKERNHEIWTCEVKKPRVIHLMCESSLCSSYKEWWTKRRAKENYATHVPKGTRGCEGIKLLEKAEG